MTEKQTKTTFRVVGIVSPSRIVIDCGTEQGLTYKARFRVYTFGEEMKDLETKQPLERVYLPRGVGEVVVLQKKICTIQSTGRSYSGPYGTMIALGGKTEIEPFDGARVGDYADLIESDE